MSGNGVIGSTSCDQREGKVQVLYAAPKKGRVHLTVNDQIANLRLRESVYGFESHSFLQNKNVKEKYVK